MQNYIKEFWYI